MQRAFNVQMVVPEEPKNSCVKYEQLTKFQQISMSNNQVPFIECQS